MEEKLRYVESLDPSFRFRRKCTIVAFSIRIFIRGLQDGLVVPTIWPYLKEFHVGVWFLGLTLVISELSAVLILPVISRIYEITGCNRRLMFVFNLFDFIGAFVYTFPYSRWLLFVGRAISGIGAAFRSIIDQEIVWLFQPIRRQQIRLYLELSRLLGLLLSPFIITVCSKIDLKFGSLRLTYANSPVLVAALLWLLMQVLTYFAVFDISKDYFGRHTYGRFENEGSEELLLVNRSPDDKNVKYRPCGSFLDTSDETPTESRFHTSRFKITMVLKQLYLPTVFAITFSTSLCMLTVVSFDTIARLVTFEYFQWDSAHLSILYSLVALCTFLLTMFTGFLQNVIRGEILLITSMFLSCISMFMLLFYGIGETTSTSAIIFCAAYLIANNSLPLCLSGTKSLLCDVMDSRKRELVHSIIWSVKKMARITAPLLSCMGFLSLREFSMSFMLLCIIGMILISLLLEKIDFRREKSKCQDAESNLERVS